MDFAPLQTHVEWLLLLLKEEYKTATSKKKFRALLTANFRHATFDLQRCHVLLPRTDRLRQSME
jgi:hypothetical protein